MEISTLDIELAADPLFDTQPFPDVTAVPDLERVGDAIAELSAHLEAATARLLDLIREFDARGGWNGGFRSCAHWLSWRVGVDLGAARERVRVARALDTLPRLASALAHGELSYAKVRALHVHPDDDGMVVVRGRLTPEAGRRRCPRNRAKRFRGNVLDGAAAG